LIVVLIKHRSKRKINVGLCNRFTQGTSIISAALSQIQKQKSWNWSICYDVFDLLRKPSMLVYGLMKNPKTYQSGSVIPLMSSFWRLWRIVFVILHSPHVYSGYRKQKKLDKTFH
jgi:hypothetical protein